jgi:hypothetical protein
MPIAEIVATFCSGTFFGAAVYISLAQHPATLDAGPGIGGRFFPPMYRRAAPMQILLAVAGTVAGTAAWGLGGTLLWLAGALILVSVIPITLLAIKPINDLLLDPAHDPDAADTGALLRRWGPKHLARSIVSGISFVLYLIASTGA